MADETLLSFYRRKRFNPVRIAIEDPAVLHDHVRKRANLYENHLGIPLSLLKGREVLEFGCNSGENAAVLALAGARLTLVEPNTQSLPRLHSLFAELGIADAITRLETTTVEEFVDDRNFDLVIAEGFMGSLEKRDDVLRAICRRIAPGGFGVFSFSTREGNLTEVTRAVLQWRACQLERIAPDSEESLEIARRLFADDFARISASRDLASWWMDNLVNPVVLTGNLWSVEEVAPIIEAEGCHLHGTSPRWSQADHFSWYKAVPDAAERHRRIVDSWARVFAYVLTGIPPVALAAEPAPASCRRSVRDLVAACGRYKRNYGEPVEALVYPAELDSFLAASAQPAVVEFNDDLRRVYDSLAGNDADRLIDAYHGASRARSCWGVSYIYLCIRKGEAI